MSRFGTPLGRTLLYALIVLVLLSTVTLGIIQSNTAHSPRIAKNGTHQTININVSLSQAASEINVTLPQGFSNLACPSKNNSQSWDCTPIGSDTIRYNGSTTVTSIALWFNATTPGAEGNYTINITTPSEEIKENLTVDGTPPVINLTTTNKTAYTELSETIMFIVNATDANGVYSVTGDLSSIGGSNSQAFTRSQNGNWTYNHTLSIVSMTNTVCDGTYTIPILVEDNASNQNTGTIKINVSIAPDLDPGSTITPNPELQYSGGGALKNDGSNNLTVRVQLIDNCGDGIKSVVINATKINGGTVTMNSEKSGYYPNNNYWYIYNGTGVKAGPSATNGIHTIYIEVEDNNGNKRSIPLQVQVEDVIPPSIILNIQNGTVTNNNTLTLRATSDEALGGCNYSLDGTGNTSMSNNGGAYEASIALPPYDTSNRNNNTHNITVYCKDNVGLTNRTMVVFYVKRDLQVESVTLNQTTAKRNETVLVTATIKTINYALSGDNITITFDCDGTVKTVNLTGVDLPANSEKNVSTTCNFSTAGEKTVTASVGDYNPPGHTVGDYNQTNNQAEATIKVSDASVTPSTLDFGSVQPGANKTLEYTITNLASKNITVSPPTLALKKTREENATIPVGGARYWFVIVGSNEKSATITKSCDDDSMEMTVYKPQGTGPVRGVWLVKIENKGSQDGTCGFREEHVLDESVWLDTNHTSDVNVTPGTTEGFNITVYVPEGAATGPGAYSGYLTYNQPMNGVYTSTPITLSVDRPSLVLYKNGDPESLVQTSTGTITWRMNVNKSSLIEITIGNPGGTQDLSVDLAVGNFFCEGTCTKPRINATLPSRPIIVAPDANQTITISLDGFEGAEGTYKTTLNVTSNNAAPYENLTVTLVLEITSNLDVQVALDEQSYSPGENMTANITVSYVDGSPVTGLSKENVSISDTGRSGAPTILEFEDKGNGVYQMVVPAPSNTGTPGKGGTGRTFSVTVSYNDATAEVTYTGTASDTYDLIEPLLDVRFESVPESMIVGNTDTVRVYIRNDGLEDVNLTDLSIDLTKLSSDGKTTLGFSECDISSGYTLKKGKEVECQFTIKATTEGTGDIDVSVTGKAGTRTYKKDESISGIDITTSTQTEDQTSSSNQQTGGLAGGLCEYDSDCDEDEYCDHYQCKALDCSSGYIALNHECVKEEYKISASISSGKRVQPNTTSKLVIVVKNEGNVPLYGVKVSLESSEWKDWYTQDIPPKDNLEPGDDTLVFYTVKIPSTATIGEHVVTVVVKSIEKTLRDDIEIIVEPDNTTREEINKSVPLLNNTIEEIEDVVSGLENSTEYLGDVESLKKAYEELERAIENGDYVTAYQKKKEIEDTLTVLMAKLEQEGVEIGNATTTTTQEGGTSPVVVIALILVVAAGGVSWLLWSGYRPDLSDLSSDLSRMFRKKRLYKTRARTSILPELKSRLKGTSVKTISTPSEIGKKPVKKEKEKHEDKKEKEEERTKPEKEEKEEHKKEKKREPKVISYREQYICPYCNQRFESAMALELHKKYAHKGSGG